MTDLSKALKGLAEVMNSIQANRKVYRLSGLGTKAIDGSGKHPSEAIWVSNAEGSRECAAIGHDNHPITLPYLFHVGDQQIIKMRAMIAKYEAEKVAYYKAFDKDTVWQIATEEDYYRLRSYMQRNETVVVKIRVWKDHLNKFADVEDRIERMPW